MKYINFLGAALLPALLLSAGIQANEPAWDPDHGQAYDQDSAGLSLSDRAADLSSDELGDGSQEPTPIPLSLTAKIRAKFSNVRKNLANYFSGLFSKSEPRVVAMGDVEGNWDKVKEFSNSNAFVGIDKKDNFYFKKDGFLLKDKYTKFVCLGDVGDWGTDSIKIFHKLVEFQKKNKDRVILLLGNRDINKIRLNWELSDVGLDKEPGEDRTEGNFAAIWSEAFDNWLIKTKKVGSEYLDGTPLYKRLLKLEWLTDKTYGAPDFYKNMKIELKKTNADISDEEVMDYIRNDYLKKDYYDYQKAAKIIYYDKDTQTIFAHGGIFSPNALGSIPGLPNMAVTDNDSLNAWIIKLNNVAQNLIELGKIEDGSHQDIVDQVMKLVAYQEPLGNVELKGDNGPWIQGQNNDSVVVGRPFIPSGAGLGAPVIEDRVPMKELAAAGVIRTVGGHSPVGQVPLVMRSKEEFTAGNSPARKFEVIDADTSYAQPARVAAVVVGKSGIAIDAVYVDRDNAEKVINVSYSTKTGNKDDADLGISSEPEEHAFTVRDRSGKPVIEGDAVKMQKAIQAWWNLGKTPDDKRLRVIYNTNTLFDYGILAQ